jgi:Ca2+-binding EF-hand superfamily protein
MQIEKFQTFAKESRDGVRFMNKESFKEMLGILGNYFISDRMFLAINTERDGLISLEDYLVYNDIITHGTLLEKNVITFNIIDVNRRGKVNFEEFKEFWLHFLELCTSVLNVVLPI